jgi:hypothetical protein
MPPVGFELLISAGERPQTARPLGPACASHHGRKTRAMRTVKLKQLAEYGDSIKQELPLWIPTVSEKVYEDF